MTVNNDALVENPTYMADIRHFFTQVDKDHMKPRGVDLSTYDGVKAKATSIYFQTQPPNAPMPPDPNPKWSEARSQTFKNWITNKKKANNKGRY